MADARRAEREAKRAERATKVSPDVAALASEPCPDPMGPDAATALYCRGYRRMWAMFGDSASTNQDVIQGFGVARLAAAVGKTPPPQTTFRLPMASLLPPQGASDAKPTGGDA